MHLGALATSPQAPVTCPGVPSTGLGAPVTCPGAPAAGLGAPATSLGATRITVEQFGKNNIFFGNTAGVPENQSYCLSFNNF